MRPTPNLNGSTVLIGANVGIITQTLLSTIGPARTQDIHGFTGYTKERNKTLLAIGKLVTELAQLCNFTPKAVSLRDPTVVMKSVGNEGILIPFVVPSVVSLHFAPLSKTKASMRLSVYQYFNFLYCDQDKDFVGIDIKVIVLPFDKFCWIFLILGCVLITALGSFTIFPNDVSAMALASIGALFLQTTTTTANYSKTKRGKSLFLLTWLASCFVLNNLYSGVVTSFLVAPVERDVIKTLDGLVSRNYRLAYHEQFKYVLKMSEKIAMGHRPNASLKILVHSAVIFPNPPEYLEALAFQSKLAMFAPYMATMAFWQLLTQKNREAWRRTGNTKFRNRYCHLGKELSSAYSIPEVWIFRMKQQQLSQELGHTFSRLDAVGIHDYWMKVFFRLQTTRRAQNLYRFKSKTEVKQDLPVEPLNLQRGSVVVIFVLYAACTLACLLSFFLEMLVAHCLFINTTRTTPVMVFLQ